MSEEISTEEINLLSKGLPTGELEESEPIELGKNEFAFNIVGIFIGELVVLINFLLLPERFTLIDKNLSTHIQTVFWKKGKFL
ncbi:MAG: hypothetical protein HWD61_04815 [Parachlamydiaceae bacterium]|nr:MAG: hypothetical protein HWD61_04815 [Parachlamydiaceae bacterium]